MVVNYGDRQTDAVRGRIAECRSTGSVTDTDRVGGLVGSTYQASVAACLQDFQTSDQAKSAGGTGKTTAERQTPATFLTAGWDFVGETANGTEDIWWIDEGKDYPRLWWEAASAEIRNSNLEIRNKLK